MQPLLKQSFIRLYSQRPILYLNGEHIVSISRSCRTDTTWDMKALFPNKCSTVQAWIQNQLIVKNLNIYVKGPPALPSQYPNFREWLLIDRFIMYYLPATLEVPRHTGFKFWTNLTDHLVVFLGFKLLRTYQCLDTNLYKGHKYERFSMGWKFPCLIRYSNLLMQGKI